MKLDTDEDIARRERNMAVNAFLISIITLFALGIGIALLLYWFINS